MDQFQGNQYGFPGNYGVTPYPQQQKPGQFAMPQFQQPMFRPSSGPDWIRVPAIGDVPAVQVPFGGKAWIMVEAEPVFAVKACDNAGITVTDYYRFAKFSPDENKTQQQNEYVTRQEFEEYKNSLLSAAKEASK